MSLEPLESRLAPAQFVWTGNVGDGKLATAGNWSGNVAPKPSDGLDDLIFQAGANTQNLTNNIGTASSPLRINSISFSQSGFTIGGNAVVLGSASSSTGTTGTITVNSGLTEVISLNMTLGGNGSGQQTFNIGTGAQLSLTGQLNGSAGAGWTKTGTGTLIIAGNNGGPTGFTGAFTAAAGITQLQNGAALGDGTAAGNTVTVQSGAQLQLNSGAASGIQVQNALRLNGVGLANSGPTAGALLNVGGNNTWAGPIELDSDVTIAAAPQNAIITAASESGTIVTATTTTQPNFAVGQTVTVNGLFPGGYDGNVVVTGVSATGFTYTAAVGLPSPAFILFPNGTAVGTSQLTITGVISDLGSGHNLTKEGAATVILDPLTAAGLPTGNTYRGTTTINNGILQVDTNQALGTGPGFTADNSTADAVIVNSNSSNNEIGTLQLAGPAGKTGLVITNKLLILNGNGFGGKGALDNLTGNNLWTGNVILGSPAPSGSSVTIEADSVDPAYDLVLSGVVSDPNGGTHTLTKTGPGVLTLTNSNTYAAATFINQGTLQIADSQALGPISKTAVTTVASGATLALTVLKTQLGAGNTPDSVTGLRNALNVYTPLKITGNGNNGVGALYSASGINQYYGTITLAAAAAIGVNADPNPTPTANYLTTDYSLTIQPPASPTPTSSGTIVSNGQTLTKAGPGQLILPTANDQMTGAVNINQGWITIQNNDSLGKKISGVAQNVQPLVTVKGKAALQLDAPAGQTLDLHQNFSLSGYGITHTFSEINQQGALENLSGINTIEGNVAFAGAVGIGVESVFGPSQLSLLGEQSQQAGGGIAVTASPTGTGTSGTSAENDNVIATGSASGTITINYNMYTIPDTIDVYYGVKGAGGIDIKSTGQLLGSGTLTVPYAPVGTFSTDTIEIVIDQGGGLTNTAWTYNALIVPTPVSGNSTSLTKLGSGLLDIQGDGTYSSPITIQQGVLLAQNNTALGVGSTASSTVTVNAGAALALANGTAYNNGGIEAGIQIPGEHLIVNGDPTLQTVTLTGSLAGSGAGNPTGTFSLTFNGYTTTALSTTVAPADLAAALNALPSIGGQNGSVTVTQSGDMYTIKFGGALAGIIQSPFQVASVSAGTRVTIGTGVGNTSLGAPVAPLAVWASTASPWNGSVTLFQSSPFLSSLTTTTVAPYGTVGSASIIPSDDQWLGPITLNVATPINVPGGSRLTVSGAIDDGTTGTGSDLIKLGTGELVLAGQNTYRGTTYVGTSGTNGALGFNPDGVNNLFSNGGAIAGGVVTVANSQGLGAASTPTVQTITLTDAQAAPTPTSYTLQFNGAATAPITYTGNPVTDAQNIANALNGLSSVGATAGTDPGGQVTVSSPGPGVFTVTFLGSFVGFNEPTILPVISGGPGSISAATTTAGTGAVAVQGGSSLQLEGTITVAGKSLAMSGTGFDAVGTPLVVPNWAAIGPAPVNGGPTINNGTANLAGRITGIAADPTDPNTIYVAAAHGAWKTVNGGATWVPLFDNYAGAAYSGAIAVAPSNSQVIYLGTGEADNSTDSFRGNGVYMSTDGGHSWTHVVNPDGSNPLNGLAVSKIAIDPGNSSLIYAATSDQAVRGSGNAGVWRFDGTTWTNLTAIVSTNRNTVAGTTATTKVAPPKDPGPDDNYLLGFPQANVTWSDVAVVGTGTNSVLYAALGTPGGSSYTNPTNPYAQAPINVNAVYYCANPTATASKIVWDIGDGIQDGETKTVDFPQVASTPGNVVGNIKLSAVVTNPFFPQVFSFGEVTVFAAYANTAGNLMAIEQGTPGGTTMNWAAGPKLFAVADYQDEYDLAILTPGLATANWGPVGTATNVYLGTQKNLQWSNAGAGFVDITTDSNSASPSLDFHALASDGANAVLAGTDGGIWSLNTNANVNTWTDLNNNLGNALAISVSSSTTDPSNILVGTQSAGIAQYVGGPTWNLATDANGVNPFWSYEPYGTQVAVDPVTPNVVYAFVSSAQIANPYGPVINNTQLMKSSDGGTTWAATGTGVAFQQNPVIALDNVNPNRILIGTNFVAGPELGESLDGGHTFRQLNLPFGFADITKVALATYQGPFQGDPNFSNVTDQGANSDVPGTMYVVTSNFGFGAAQIYVTRDYGQTWVARPIGGLTGINGQDYISDLEVDPSNSSNVYALSEGPAGSGLGRVLFSSDGGLNWQILGGQTGNLNGLPDAPAHKLVIDPRTGNLYVANDVGVYELSANSTTWQQLGTGLPRIGVTDLYLNPVSNTLLAATYGRGVFALPLSSTVQNAGALTSLSGAAQWAGPVLLAGATTLSADGSQELQNDLSAAQLNITGTITDLGGTANNALTVGTANATGTVTFSGANTYTGVTNVAAGVLRVNNLTALGSPGANSGTFVSEGAALQLESNVDNEYLTLEGNGPVVNGHNTGALQSIANNNSYAGPITLAPGNSTDNVTIGVASGSTLTITGVISGSANLIKELTGTLALDQPAATPDQYTGLTEVYQGALLIESPVALAQSAGTVVYDGAQLQLAGGVIVTGESLDLSGSGINNTGALLNLGGANAWNGPITLDALPGFDGLTYPSGTVTIGVGQGGATDPTDVLTLSGPITEKYATLFSGITKVGADALVLTAANTYNGSTFINGGTVTIKNANALGDPTNNAIQRLTVYNPVDENGSFVPGSFTLSLTINGQQAISNAITSSQSDQGLANDVAAALKQLLTALNVSNVTASVQLQAEPIGGTLTPHEVALTIMFQGTGLAGLNLPQLVALATGSTVVESDVADYQAGTVVANGAALLLDLAGSTNGTTVNESVQVNGSGPAGNGAIENVSGTNNLTGTVTLAGNSTIGVDTANGSLTLSGQVADPVNVAATPGALTKVGPGTLALTHANTYQGTTYVNAGYLAIANSAALGGAVTNDVQTITISGATTGSYQLVYTDSQGNSQTTTSILASAPASQVQAALEQVVGIGNVSVTQNAAGDVYTVTFIGTLAGQDQQRLTVTNNTGGGSTLISVVTQVHGGLGNTVVAAGATLQLTGGITVSTEQAVLNGTGVNNNGALESILGANTWAADPAAPDAALILATSGSLGADGGTTLNVTGAITGAGSLTVEGGGTVIFGTGAVGASNSYAGSTTVAGSTLLLDRATQTITSASENGSTVTITTSTTLGINTGQWVSISGVQTAGYNGMFQVTGVSGTTFTYTAPTTNLGTDTAGGTAGFVAVPHDLTVGDGSTNVTTAIVRLEANGQLASGAKLTINSNGLFDPNGLAQTVSTLAMVGGAIDLSNATSLLVLAGPVTATSDAQGDPATILSGATTSGRLSLANTTQTFTVNAGPASPQVVDMDIQVPVTVATGSFAQLIKAGTGRLALDSPTNVTSLPNPIVVNAGDLQVNGSVGEVDMAGTTASVSGNGSVGVLGGIPVSGGTGEGSPVVGTINPGDNGSGAPTGILTSNAGNIAEFWGPQTRLWVDLQQADINGAPAPGAGYDQLNVSGNFDLGGATITGAASNTIGLGDTFTILQATGGGVISGAFTGAGTETATVEGVTGTYTYTYVGGAKFDIFYGGVDANGNATRVDLVRAKQSATITLVTSATTAVYGQDVTYTATVSVDRGAGSAVGDTVDFTVSGYANPFTVTIGANGTAVFDPYTALGAPLNPGTYTVSATYAGEGQSPNYVIDPVTAAKTVSTAVGIAATTTTFSLDQTSLSYVYGQDVKVQATVAPKAPSTLVNDHRPGSNVTQTEFATLIVDGGTAIPPIQVALNSGGIAQYSLANLNLQVGSHTIAVTYPGDGTYYGASAASTLRFQVTKDQSSLTLTYSTTGAPPVNGQAAFGQTVTSTAAVSAASPGTATPSGTVSFYDNNSLIGTGTLGYDSVTRQWEATYSTSTLGVGSHSISASYAGTTQLAGVANSLNGVAGPNFTVSPNTTTTSLSVSPAASSWSFNQQIIFTATVALAGASTTIPQGNVVLFDDISGTPVQLGTSVIGSNGQAVFTTTSLTVGAHDIYAVYAGNTNNGSSTSNHIQGSVALGSLAVVSSSANPITNGAEVTFTATVSGGAGATGVGTPTGYIIFTDITTGLTLGKILLTNGQASVTTTTPLSPGPHSIQAQYSGDSTFAGTTSNTFTENVRVTTGVTLTTDGSPSAVGAPVNITATVTPTVPSAFAPTGTVTFYDNNLFIGYGSLVDVNGIGTATLTTSSLIRGVHNLTASYAGDPDFTASATAGPVTQTVLYSAVTTVSSGAYIINDGGSFNLIATVAPARGTPRGAGAPTGTVSFYADAIDPSDLLGQANLNTYRRAVLPVSTLGFGSHTIYAVYNGNTNYGTATGVMLRNETVQSPTTTTVTSSDANALYSEQLTFTATVTATATGATPPIGRVNFFNGSSLLGTAPLSASDVNASTATLTLTTAQTLNLTLGNHTIRASFVPESGQPFVNLNHGGDGTMSQSISAAATTTTFTSSSATTDHITYNSVYGEPVTLTATVAANLNGATAVSGPSGYVQFMNGTALLATAKLDTSGTASYTIPAPRGNPLNAGTYSFSADYLPGSGYSAQATPPTITQNVAADTTTVTLTSSANPGPVGGSVTITATVSADAPGVGTPTGTIEFFEPFSGTDYAPIATLSGGKATFTLTDTGGLQFTDYNIQAKYTPATGANYQGNSSAVFVESAMFGTTTTLTATPSSATVGNELVTLTATVASLTPALAPTPTSGNVDFYDTVNGQQTLLGTVAVDPAGSGVEQLVLDNLPAGTNVITATYKGDGFSYAGSSAAAKNVVIYDMPNGINATLKSSSGTYNGLPRITLSSYLTITATVTGTQGGAVTNLPPNAKATITSNLGLYGVKSVYFRNGKFIFSGLRVATTGNYSITVNYAGFTTTINFSVGGRMG